MKNFLALAAAIVVVFAALGWYLDWYRLTSRPNGGGGHTVTIDVNTEKIAHDIKKAKEKLQKAGEENKGTQVAGTQTNANTDSQQKPAPQQGQTPQADGFWIVPPDVEKELFGSGTQRTSSTVPALPPIPQVPQNQRAPQFRAPAPSPQPGTNQVNSNVPDAWQFPETQSSTPPATKKQTRGFFFLPRPNN